MRRPFLYLLLAGLIAACQPAAQSAPTEVVVEPTVVAQQPTTEPSPVITQRPTNAVQPTSAPPPTAIPFDGSGNGGGGGSASGGGTTNPGLLNNGRGLTTGSTVNNGEFEVEGYCTLLNSSYGVENDTNNWYCTQNGSRVLTLTGREFDDICRRTYNDPDAVARQDGGGNIAAYRWRCYDSSFGSQAPGVGLLDNGVGLSTGRIVNNGEFEVEGYCRLINMTFGVDFDRDNWYCTLNGQRIMTLSEREFSDICRRTYSDLSAFALQNGDADRPAFRWRCYGNQ